MAKLTLSSLYTLQNEQSALSVINNNNTAVIAAMENTLSRDGTSPNSMQVDFDMNSNHILNLPAPGSDIEPVRIVDLPDYVPQWYIQSTEPNVAGIIEGSLWLDSNSDLLDLYKYENGVWVDLLVGLRGEASLGITSDTSLGTDNVLIRSDGIKRGAQATGIVVDDSNNMSGANNILHAGYLRVGSLSTPSNTTAGDLTFVRGFASGVVSISATTASTSTTSGALTVAGGLGVAGSLYAGTQIRATGTSARFAAVTTDSNNPEFSMWDTTDGGWTFFSQGGAFRLATLNSGGIWTANVLTGSTVGYIGIGTASPDTLLSVNANTVGSLPALPANSGIAHFVGADGLNTRIYVETFRNSQAVAPVLVFRSANGTAASPTAIASGDNIGQISAFGYGATGWINSGKASIKFTASQTWTDSVAGAKIEFVTTAIGGTSNTVKWTMTDVGDLVGVSTTASTSSTTGALVVAGGLGVAGAVNANALSSFSQGATFAGNSGIAAQVTDGGVFLLKGGGGQNFNDAANANNFSIKFATSGLEYNSNGGAYLLRLTTGGDVKIAGTTTSTSTTTGALTVAGGLGVTGAVWFGGGSASDVGIGVWGGDSSYSSLTFNGTHTATSMVGFIGGGTADNCLYSFVPSGNAFYWRVNNSAVTSLSSSTLAVLATTATTSSTTGALTVAGGLGVAGAGYFGGNVIAAKISANNADPVSGYSFGVTPSLQVNGTNFPTGSMQASNWAASANGGVIFLSKSRGGTVGTHTVVNNGDDLGEIRFHGSDGTQFQAGARIAAVVDGTPGTSDMPGKLIFQTTLDGTNSYSTRLTIYNDGGITIGAPTGGSKGSGTLSVATSYYLKGGSVVSDSGGGFTRFGNHTDLGSYWDLGSTSGDYAVLRTDGTISFQDLAGSVAPLDIFTTGTVQVVVNTSALLKVQSTTASTSSTTGALTVAGGLGVAGIIYAGSTIHATQYMKIIGTGDGALHWYVGSSSSNEKTWEWYANGTVMDFRLIDDAYSASNQAIRITRSGYTVSSVKVYNGSSTLALTIGAGLVVGAATGGDKGAGTLNMAADIYKNNTAYTNPDYAFEHYYTGKIERFAKNEGASAYQGLMKLDDLRAYTKTHLRLPGFTDEGVGIFARSDIILEKFEELTLHTLELHDRISKLERGSK